MASARTESNGTWRVVGSTGHAQAGLSILTQPKGYAAWLRPFSPNAYGQS
ncbi:MAG: hypothetical protein ACI8XO_002221, partial [Verrucomicrobiales bacterium]